MGWVEHNELTTQSGQIDARSFMDGSGWTVSTGSSTRATGGDRAQGSDAWGDVPASALASPSAPAMAGLTPTTLALAVAALFGLALLKRS